MDLRHQPTSQLHALVPDGRARQLGGSDWLSRDSECDRRPCQQTCWESQTPGRAVGLRVTQTDGMDTEMHFWPIFENKGWNVLQRHFNTEGVVMWQLFFSPATHYVSACVWKVPWMEIRFCFCARCCDKSKQKCANLAISKCVFFLLILFIQKTISVMNSFLIDSSFR